MHEKSIFKNATKQKERNDDKVAHGQTESLNFLPGVRKYMPLDRFGRPLPVGSNITTEFGEMTLYDGQMTIVDSEYFDKLVGQHKKRKEYVSKLSDAFLEAGDSLCISTIGPYFNWLPVGGPQTGENRDLFKKCLMLDGYSSPQADAIINRIIQVDGTPNTIKSYTNPSQAFTDCLNKLQWVLRYVGVVFTGSETVPIPDIPLNPENNIYNANALATEASKQEVARNRGFNAEQSRAILN